MTSSRCASAAVAVAVGAALVAGGCSTEGPDSTTIEMTGADRYVPSTVTVRVGSAVTWSNASTDQHTVSAPTDDERARVPEGGEAIDSGTVQPGDAFTRRFTSVGTYVFYCDIHVDDGMIGAVEVVR